MAGASSSRVFYDHAKDLGHHLKEEVASGKIVKEGWKLREKSLCLRTVGVVRPL